MAPVENQQTILNILNNLQGLGPLKDLFWTQLNYERINEPLSRRSWIETTRNALAEDPLLFAGGGQDNGFHVIYARLASDNLLLGAERPVVSRLLQDHPYSLFVFSNRAQDRWHFINIKYDDDEKKRRMFRRITVGKEERLRTASERLALIDLERVQPDLFGLSPLAIQQRHDEAFNVEAVTKQFFDEYKAIFEIFEDDLYRQTKDRSWAHDYALQFLNRCMFLYFVQRKGWLGNDSEFLRTFWETYSKSSQPQNTFTEQWLKVLFFEAFNNQFHGGHKHFPDEIKEIMALAPFLNGGLFTKNHLDNEHIAIISDNRFAQIFKFLERYNFTIAEDSPLDKEVAVDPEMIGKVYESLVNVSEEVDERGEAGIFYTPRTEIDLMCRLALADNLANHLGAENKSLLNQLVFSLEPEEKTDADKVIARARLWPAIQKRLRDVTVLDPACGSGSFLVGMLHILDDLQERAGRQLGLEESAYERKKRVIGESLYGVDVMDWACHVAELRLWLALVIDAELTPAELHVRQEPILPHFTFKIRCGDSLVQEVGGINFGHMRAVHGMPSELKARITRLKTEKLKFYNNDPSCKFNSPQQARQEEGKLFADILASMRHKREEEIKSLRRKLEGPQELQIGLDGKMARQSHQMGLDTAKLQDQIESLKSEVERILTSLKALESTPEVPFVWDIAFVEIFEGESDGFDIVIGNPPYVRQEDIADPCVPRDEVTTESKKAYKAKLARSVYQSYPHFFGYKPVTDAVAHKLDGKSDLYIHFYFHAMSLLNSQGSFCFITSNSWLDVGYGKDLQEFLLKHSHVKMVLDNSARRSFSSADVNTIIALFSAPDDMRQWALDKTTRFVMFKVPFEHIVSPIIFDEIETVEDKKITHEYRVFPIMQLKLLEDGCEMPEEEETGKTTGPLMKVSKYIGNKWGGKYLRAPDIYWTILEKGKGKLVRLGDITNPRFGIKTGANEFFYLDAEQIDTWQISRKYLEPAIKSPRECSRILVGPSDFKYGLLMCHEDKEKLKGTPELEYIRWGESQGFHKRPSCRGRQRWWDLGDREKAFVNVNYLVDKVMRFFVSESGFYVSDNFHEIHSCRNISWQLAVACNSSIFQLFTNIAGRANFGDGLMKIQTYEVADLPLLDPNLLDEKNCRAVLKGSERLDLEDDDRRNLDSVIFDTLHLSSGECDGIYEALIELVERRLKKASSLK